MTALARAALVLTLLTLSFAAGSAVVETPAETERRIARIEQGLVAAVRIQGRPDEPKRLVDVMREHQVPAVSIAVIDDGRIAWARSYGLADPSSGRVATAETLFQAASISKPVAAMGALDLVEAGYLALDEPVNAGLSTWRIPVNAFTEARPVTLRHLLTHTGGLTVHGFPGYPRGAPLPTVRQILEGLPPANTSAVVVDQPPGEAFRYSGGGFTVVQVLMSDLTGEPFHSLLQERVLAPLGMTSSTYDQCLPESWHRRAATGHRADGTPIPGRYHLYPEMAAAGLWTTPTDLARWVIAVQNALAGRAEPVLAQAMADAMVTRGPGGWGLGINVEGEGDSLRFSHGGANEGFRAQMIGFAGAADGVVVMTNSDAGTAVIAPLIRAVAAEYDWRGFEPEVIVPVEVKPAALRQLVGRYEVDDDAVIVRAVADGRSLELVTSGGETYDLVPVGPDRFADTVQGLPFRFVRDSSGNVDELDAAGTTLKRATPAGD